MNLSPPATTGPSSLHTLEDVLKTLKIGTQEELRCLLFERGHDVTQSTVSRMLKKLGVVRIFENGESIYQLPEDSAPPSVDSSLFKLVRDVQNNENMIVIHTSIGSAPFIARYLDHYKQTEILGTIAGDDTIMVIPRSVKNIRQTVHAIKELFLKE